MLKKMTTEAPIEEDELSTRLMAVQMWMIYWIVHGCVGIVESLLLLTYLPMYSVVRFCVSVWLISPIFLTSMGLTHPNAPVLETQIKAKWAEFFSLGCGLVFSQVVKPFMDERLDWLKLLGTDRLLMFVNSVKSPLSHVLGTTGGSSSEIRNAEAISNVIWSSVPRLFFFFSLLASNVKEKENGTDSIVSSDIEEYDILDSPPTVGSTDGEESRGQVRKPSSRFWLW